MEKRKATGLPSPPDSPDMKKQRLVEQWERAKILAEYYCVDLKERSTVDTLITLLREVVPQDFFVKRLGVELESPEHYLRYIERHKFIIQWLSKQGADSDEKKHKLLCREMSLYFGFVVAGEDIKEIEGLFSQLPNEVIVILGERMDLETLKTATTINSLWRDLLKPVLRRRTFAAMRHSLLKRFLFHTIIIGERWKLILMKREDVTFDSTGKLVQSLKWMNQVEPQFEAMFEFKYRESKTPSYNSLAMVLSATTEKSRDFDRRMRLKSWILETRNGSPRAEKSTIVSLKEDDLESSDDIISIALYDFIHVVETTFLSTHVLLLLTDQYVQDETNIRKAVDFAFPEEEQTERTDFSNARQVFVKTCKDSLSLTQELRYFSICNGPKFDTIGDLDIDNYERAYMIINTTRIYPIQNPNVILYKCGDAFRLFLEDPEERLVKLAAAFSGDKPPPSNYCLRQIDDKVLDSSHLQIIARLEIVLFRGTHSPANVIWKHFESRK